MLVKLTAVMLLVKMRTKINKIQKLKHFVVVCSCRVNTRSRFLSESNSLTFLFWNFVQEISTWNLQRVCNLADCLSFLFKTFLQESDQTEIRQDRLVKCWQFKKLRSNVTHGYLDKGIVPRSVFFNLGSANSFLGSLKMLKIVLYGTFRFRQLIRNFQEVPRIEKG
jgi:hypothetical protein